PLRDTGRPAPRAIQDYDKVIERCTYILTEYPNSRWADDALFLLARSVYYKKVNPLQAKERFQDLLRFFPNSKYVPESNIYIAKIDYEMRDQREAHRRLQELLDNENYHVYHPEILLLKSSYYLEERDFLRAQNHLQMIIDNYPKSHQFEMAFFTLGKAYLENEEYEKSQEIFEILLNTRASRRTKFNSRYYIALNRFHLQDYDQALTILERLIRQEYEPAEFPKLHILKARCLIGQKEYNEAESLLSSVIQNNSRTVVAAEASYYLAEMYFLDLLNYEKAIEYYNRIQTEFRTSPFVERGVARSAVVSQIIQFSRQDRQISTIDLINEQFKLAEYYLYVMNMPDSTLSVYKDIGKQEVRLSARLDSLRAIPVSDLSREIPNIEQDGIVESDEQKDLDQKDVDDLHEEKIYDHGFDLSEADEEMIIKMLEAGLDISDLEAEFLNRETVRDEVIPDEQDEDQDRTNEIETPDIYPIEAEISKLEDDLHLYRTEFVPYSMFASSWVWLNKKNSPAKAEEIYAEMQQKNPYNRYTYAVESMLAGEEIRFATPYELDKEEEYEDAITQINDNPTETLNLLNSISEELSNIEADETITFSERLENIYYKTLFTLGYTYYFHLSDSLNAKIYFDRIIEEQSDSEYSRFIDQFYQDNHFVVIDSLPALHQEVVIDEEPDETISKEEAITEDIREEKFIEENGAGTRSSGPDDKIENRILD
ncbi:MAG: tetratricopeptide repeat protein, partial [Candidatus Cloacimonetes bacterium]|nr:tetratricopeptide repeat protein [Candidatus Cloacimonadota bacterium]